MVQKNKLFYFLMLMGFCVHFYSKLSHKKFQTDPTIFSTASTRPKNLDISIMVTGTTVIRILEYSLLQVNLLFISCY